MGFGFLLAGYLLSFVCVIGLGEYIFAGMLIGGIVMLIGLLELRKYDPVFLYPIIINCLILLCSLIWGGAYLLSLIPATEFSIPEWLHNWGFSAAKSVLYLLFDISMLYGIADLSRRVEYPATREKAFRNMIYVGIYNAFQIFTLLPVVSNMEASDRGAILKILVIVNLAYTLINLALIFKCYAMICPAGQEDVPRRRSRFAFVNKIRDARDAREERALKEMQDYYDEKRRAKFEKKPIQHHGKKKKKKK